MNHAYRVVWNQALQVWTAVAEISRRKGKTKASVLLSGLLLGASPVGAAEETFTAATGNWSVDGNWADGSAPVSGTDLQLNFEYVDYDNGYESIHDLGDLTVNRLSFSTSNPIVPLIDVYAASAADTLTFDGPDATIDVSSPSEAWFDVDINPEVVLVSTLRVAASGPTSNKNVYFKSDISGAGGLRVSEGVAVHLTGNDGGRYTGDTTIAAGGVLANARRTSNTLSAASRHIVHGELRLLESGAIGSLEGSGLVTIDNGKSLEVGALDTDTLFSGVIRDMDQDSIGSLIKTGSGTLTLTGANTYTGGTTINGGALQIGDGGTSGAIAGNVVNNSSLVFNRADDSTFAGDISGTGTVSKQGSGTLTLTGTNTYTGGATYTDGTTISNGTLAVRDGGSISHGTTGLTVGDTAGQTGTLEIGAGSSVTSHRSHIGRGGGTGVVRVGGSGARWQLTERLYVGVYGEGTLDVHDGGEVDVASPLEVGNASGATGRVTVDGAGSELKVTSLTLGYSGNGTLTLANGGTTSINGGGGEALLGQYIGSQGTLNFGAYDLADPTTAGVLDADRLRFGSSSPTPYGGPGGTGAINFNQTDTLTLAADIVKGYGTGSVNQRGTGTTILTGNNSYSGDTTISDGTLVVNGTINNSRILVTGGTLGGSGTVSSVEVNSGTVSPGNSIGTLNVTGDWSLASGATYRVELISGGTTAGTHNDLVDVGGNAVIEDGALLHVTPENGSDDGSTYADGSTYTIVRAAGGMVVNGTQTLSDDYAYLDFSTSHDSDGYYLTSSLVSLPEPIQSFCLDGMSGNQCSTGDGAFQLAGGHPVYDQILNMSEAEARAALNALSGELHASARAQLATQSDGVRLAALERLQSTSLQAGTGLWFDMLYSDSEQNGGTGIARLDSQSQGLLLGADGYLQNGWRLGVLGGYQNSDMNLDARASSAEVDSLHLGVYASKRWNNWHLSLGGAFGQHQLQTQRHALGQTLNADYDVSSWQAFAETGYRFEADAGWLQPFVGLAWLKQRNDAFKESGGSAALAVERTETSTGFGSLGVRAGAQLGAGPLPVRVQGSLSWRHAFDDIDTVSQHRFLGGDHRFSIKGTPIAENTIVVDAGLVVPLADSADISIGYRGEHAHESERQEGYVQMSVRF